jgi:predicted methyltransferase
MNKLISFLSLSLLFSFSSPNSAHDLMTAIQSEDRTPKNVLRDEFRNPAETLTFFKIKPDMRIVELSPGGGWYTEILANYLHDPGMLIAAHFDKDSEVGYFKRGRANFEKKIKNQ